MFDHFDISPEYLLNPLHIFVIISSLLGIYGYQLKERRKLLFYKLLSDVAYAIYLFVMGGFAGAFMIVVAILGGGMQILTPEDKQESTTKFRIAFAVILSLVVVSFAVKQQNDVLPVLAVIYSRFAELITDRQIMAFCLMIAGVTWFCYLFNEGILLALVKNMLSMTSIAFGLYRNRQQKVSSYAE